MAHFAEIDENDFVIRVVVVDDEHQDRGQEFLAEDIGLGGTWVQTSYNSRGGVHYLPDSDIPSGKPHLRYNYAGPGMKYDRERDAFIKPKPHPDAVFDENTCLWILPIEMEIDLAIPSELTE